MSCNSGKVLVNEDKLSSIDGMNELVPTLTRSGINVFLFDLFSTDEAQYNSVAHADEHPTTVADVFMKPIRAISPTCRS